MGINGGTVEGVWVFHRHGDRTPTRPLASRSADSRRRNSESDFWNSVIPSGRPCPVYASLSSRYPPDVHTSNGAEFLDAARDPYGFLTYRGMDQMRDAGRRCAVRYNRIGHQSEIRGPDPPRRVVGGKGGDGSSGWCIGFGNDLSEYWDIEASSTNYLRTVKSAQCFLDGLVGTGKEGGRDYWDAFADRAAASDGEGGRGDDRAGPSVRVRDREGDTLNAFDRDPDLMRDLVSDVVSGDEFARVDGAASPLAALLAGSLPGLAEDRGRHAFPSPSGINWIHAADHFVCRGSHGVPYTAFSGAGGDELDPSSAAAAARAEQVLAALRGPTLSHLAWRFRMWYRSPPLLAAVAAPPLREVEGGVRDALTLDQGDKRPFAVHSCHDVTILSLLYGVRASFLMDDEDKAGGGDGGMNFWPPYASTLIFELVRTRPRHMMSNDGGDPDDTHAVRILLNGAPVFMRSLSDGGGETMAVLRPSEFFRLISDLEERGGWGEGGG